MTKNKGRELAALVTLLVVLSVAWANQSVGYALGQYKWFLPFVTNNPNGMPQPRDLRIDTIQLYALDAALLNIGITDASTRAQIVQEETARRGGAGPAPEGYPSPQSEVEAILTFHPSCFQGQACATTWQGGGHMRSRYCEELLGCQLWSVGVICPPGAVCTVVSSVAGDNSLPLYKERKWVMVQLSSGVGWPVWLGSKCFWQT